MAERGTLGGWLRAAFHFLAFGGAPTIIWLAVFYADVKDPGSWPWVVAGMTSVVIVYSEIQSQRRGSQHGRKIVLDLASKFLGTWLAAAGAIWWWQAG